MRLRDKLLIVTAAVVLLFFAVTLLPGVVATVWVPSCEGCHGVVAESWSTGTHAEQKCNTCHGGSTGWAAWRYRNAVMYDMILPWTPLSFDARTVPNTRCRTCHESEEFPDITIARGIRIDHRACTDGLTCTSCHMATAHTVKTTWPLHYSMNQCLRCHANQAVASHDGCEQCHDGKLDTREGVQTSSFALTHSKDWERTHGMGDVDTCRACHEQRTCEPCHGKLVPHDMRLIYARHGEVARESDNKCASCHRNSRFCDDCHQLEMPHPSNFLQSHSVITADKGEKVCRRCHTKTDCEDCHGAHAHPGGARR